MLDSTLLQNKYGFTLIELIVVIAVLGILAGIVVPRYVGYLQSTRATVCQTNTGMIERMYGLSLENEGIDHQESRFMMFLAGYSDELCPENGLYSYFDGNVHCSVHGDKIHEDEEVPYL